MVDASRLCRTHSRFPRFGITQVVPASHRAMRFAQRFWHPSGSNYQVILASECGEGQLLHCKSRKNTIWQKFFL